MWVPGPCRCWPLGRGGCRWSAKPDREGCCSTRHGVGGGSPGHRCAYSAGSRGGACWVTRDATARRKNTWCSPGPLTAKTSPRCCGGICSKGEEPSLPRKRWFPRHRGPKNARRNQPPPPKRFPPHPPSPGKTSPKRNKIPIRKQNSIASGAAAPAPSPLPQLTARGSPEKNPFLAFARKRFVLCRHADHVLPSRLNPLFARAAFPGGGPPPAAANVRPGAMPRGG